LLKLPTYQQLSKEQDAINNLPLTGSYLVVGPPGTGKTVMAIYRAAMFRRAGKATQFMVYNRTLRQYLEEAMEATGVEGVASTFHSWFDNWYWKNFGRRPPMLERFVHDWTAIWKDLIRRHNFEKYDHLVIDEGQDFPKDFYTVMQLIATDITVFADENQRITETNSTLKEIEKYVRPKQVHRLSLNYRNTRSIARFARHFYADLQSGVPDLPEKKGPRPRAVSCQDVAAQIDFIARYERNNDDTDIGVFIATKRQLFRILRELQGKTTNPVQTYVSGKKEYQTLDFTRRGIRLIMYPSAKGLEFDTVFLPLLDQRVTDPDSDIENMRFYVMASRARQELYMTFSGEELPPLLKAVPEQLFDIQRPKRQRSKP
jgi:superfamily I DNA/RNA helicase